MCFCFLGEREGVWEAKLPKINRNVRGRPSGKPEIKREVCDTDHNHMLHRALSCEIWSAHGLVGVISAALPRK